MKRRLEDLIHHSSQPDRSYLHVLLVGRTKHLRNTGQCDLVANDLASEHAAKPASDLNPPENNFEIVLSQRTFAATKISCISSVKSPEALGCSRCLPNENREHEDCLRE